MESSTVVDERERERERVRKILLGVIVFVGILLYAGFNVWVYRSAKSGKAPSPKEVFQTATGLNPVKKQGSTLPESFSPPSTPSPTPTPRPTGPGAYACDPYGVCNRYSDEARAQYCTVTYADDRCLDRCGDKEKQCSM